MSLGVPWHGWDPRVGSHFQKASCQVNCTLETQDMAAAETVACSPYTVLVAAPITITYAVKSVETVRQANGVFHCMFSFG